MRVGVGIGVGVGGGGGVGEVGVAIALAVVAVAVVEEEECLLNGPRNKILQIYCNSDMTSGIALRNRLASE